jgi:hypothetical protein
MVGIFCACALVTSAPAASPSAANSLFISKSLVLHGPYRAFAWVHGTLPARKSQGWISLGARARARPRTLFARSVLK